MILKFIRRSTIFGLSYILKEIENPNETTLKLINENLLHIISYNDSDYLDSFPLGEPDQVGVYIAKTEMVDDGDYNFDDEWDPSYREANKYYPCRFCPITGEEIKIEIIGEEDKADESEELNNKISKLSKNVQKKKVEERERLYRELEELTRSDYSKIYEYIK